MLIDFDTLEPQRIARFKGGEGELEARIFSDRAVRILRFVIEPGTSIGPHIHTDSSEVMYLLSGRGTVVDRHGETPLLPGQCSYCPKGDGHSFRNDGDETVELLAVVPQQ